MAGKTVVVTGANSGLGLASARSMYLAGAHVVMGCRSMARCNAAKDSLLEVVDGGGDGGSAGGSAGRGTAEAMELDLASFDSVRQFSALFKQAHGDQLDVLMLNAGGAFPVGLTPDGVETSFQVNHLSHHLLTRCDTNKCREILFFLVWRPATLLNVH